jgi:hypothetical protein
VRFGSTDSMQSQSPWSAVPSDQLPGRHTRAIAASNRPHRPHLTALLVFGHAVAAFNRSAVRRASLALTRTGVLAIPHPSVGLVWQTPSLARTACLKGNTVSSENQLIGAASDNGNLLAGTALGGLLGGSGAAEGFSIDYERVPQAIADLEEAAKFFKDRAREAQRLATSPLQASMGSA